MMLKKHQYMCAFACLDCRKVFKRPVDYPVSNKDDKKKCQHCDGVSYNVGRKFHAPKRSDDKAWALVEFLLQNGFGFHSVYEPDDRGFSVRVPYPKTIEEAKQFVVKYKDKAIYIEE